MGKIVDSCLTSVLNSRPGNKINGTLVKISESKAMSKLAQHCINASTNPKDLDPAKLKSSKAIAGAGLAVASIATKDIASCICYVYNDLTNKKIPEEQRPFSAAMDLANGIVGVGVQLITTKLLQPSVEKLFNKATKPFWTQANVSKIAQSVAQKANISVTDATKYTNSKLKDLKAVTDSGFSTISSLILAGIIAKRIISPLISTPLASAIKPYIKKLFGSKKTKKTNENNNNEITQKVPQKNIERTSAAKLSVKA